MINLLSVKGIKSKKILKEELQLCAGHKIKWKPPPFYEYEGAGVETKFQKINPIKNYASPREKVLPSI